MKKLYLLVCLILLSAIQGCSMLQVTKGGSDDETVVVQDSTSQNKPIDTKKIKPGKKPKPNDKDVGQVDNKDTLQTASDSIIVSLRNRVTELENVAIASKTVWAINDKEFFGSIIEAPLLKAYDSIQVGYYMQLIELFDYKGKKEIKRKYDIYYPLLANYGTCNNEIAGIIRGVVRSFELLAPDSPDMGSEKTNFERSLGSCTYYKKYRQKENDHQKIKYLEDVITDTRSLFEDPSKFTKENFEEQLLRLGIEK